LRKRVVYVEKRYALEGRKSRCVGQGMQRRDSRSTPLGQLAIGIDKIWRKEI
jgi:hypothetical protein